MYYYKGPRSFEYRKGPLTSTNAQLSFGCITVNLGPTTTTNWDTIENLEVLQI